MSGNLKKDCLLFVLVLGDFFKENVNFKLPCDCHWTFEVI